MRFKLRILSVLAICVIPILIIVVSVIGSRLVTTWSQYMPSSGGITVIIDAGHGGEDGGAISCTGCPESAINLEISLRLNDLMHLLGIRTLMIRKHDESVSIQGNTIAQRKLSDLKQRVKTVNNTPNCILISIHQNYFTDSRYYGPQVFYAESEGSKAFAAKMQQDLVNCLVPTCKRKEKPCTGVYLMEKISAIGILIECGFLSNPQEEAKLRNEQYQKDLCCVIAASTSRFIADRNALT